VIKNLVVSLATWEANLDGTPLVSILAAAHLAVLVPAPSEAAPSVRQTEGVVVA